MQKKRSGTQKKSHRVNGSLGPHKTVRNQITKISLWTKIFTP